MRSAEKSEETLREEEREGTSVDFERHKFGDQVSSSSIILQTKQALDYRLGACLFLAHSLCSLASR